MAKQTGRRKNPITIHNNERVRTIVEDFKEAGQEYRYRDQLMVTHFGFSMTASGILLNVLSSGHFVSGSQEELAVRWFGLIFLLLVTYHLGMLNFDRVGALDQKNCLAQSVIPNLQIARRKFWWRPQCLSPSTLMPVFSGAVAAAWAWWTYQSIFLP